MLESLTVSCGKIGFRFHLLLYMAYGWPHIYREEYGHGLAQLLGCFILVDFLSGTFMHPLNHPPLVLLHSPY